MILKIRGTCDIRIKLMKLLSYLGPGKEMAPES